MKASLRATKPLAAPFLPREVSVKVSVWWTMCQDTAETGTGAIANPGVLGDKAPF
jgi:hypothetical protein